VPEQNISFSIFVFLHSIVRKLGSSHHVVGLGKGLLFMRLGNIVTNIMGLG